MLRGGLLRCSVSAPLSYFFSLRLPQANGAQSQKEPVAKVNGASDRACLSGVLRCFYVLAGGIVMESGAGWHCANKCSESSASRCIFCIHKVTCMTVWKQMYLRLICMCDSEERVRDAEDTSDFNQRFAECLKLRLKRNNTG